MVLIPSRSSSRDKIRLRANECRKKLDKQTEIGRQTDRHRGRQTMVGRQIDSRQTGRQADRWK